MMNRRALPLILIIFSCLFLGVASAETRYTPLNVYEYSDDSITPYMFFDEANYIYVTPYGNYTFLQPGNILQYTDYRGQEIITQSVFVTQYDNFGNWLPLLDFFDRAGGDPAVTVANDTYYEWQYNVYDKKVPVAVGKLSFTANPGEMPKIHTEITPNENWDAEGFTDFRWIWDLVPWVNSTSDVGFTYYRNQTSGETVDIRDFTDLRELYTAQPNINDTASYEEINNQARIKIFDNQTRAFSGILDVSSYNATTWYGGQEPNWNSKGFVTIFPVNEAVIDPIAYTEYAPELIIDPSGWSEVDCGSAPANSVAEIIAVNLQAASTASVGVRNTSSTIDRRLILNEAEDGGVTATRFLTSVDGDGNVTLFGSTPGAYYLVGYWEDIIFTEQWVSYSVTSSEDDVWHETDGTELSLNASQVHLITITHDDAGKNQVAGVRNTTSSLTRSVDIMEAEGGGLQTVSMFVQADASAAIDVYTAQYDDHVFINQGYFDDTVNFTENYQSFTSGFTSWYTVDLSAYLDQDGRIADILCVNSHQTVNGNTGARENGTSTNRYIDLREAEGAGVSAYGLTTKTDATGSIESYSAVATTTQYFTGYFVFGAGGPTPYVRGVDQGISVASAVTRVTVCYRGTSQSVSVASDTARVLDAKRGTTQGISMASAVVRLYGAVRNPTQGITVASAISRGFNAIRGVDQSVVVGSAVSRVLGAIRGVTQSITTGSAVSRLYTIVRNVAQSINVASAVTRALDAIRGVTQSIDVASAVTRSFNAIRGVSQGITASSAVSRVYTIIRGLTQAITVGSDTGKTYGAVRGVTQGITVSNAVSRLFNAIRATSQSITTSSAVSRVYGVIRGLTQGITVSSSVSRTFQAVRGLTQSVDVAGSVSRGFNAIRGVTQGINVANAVTRIYTKGLIEYIRGLSQSIDIGSDVTRVYGAIRDVTQSVDVASAVTRTYNAIRGLTQSITTSSAVSRVYTIIRGLTQSITVGSDTTRILNAIRGANQGISISSAVTRAFAAIRGVSQSIGFDGSVTRIYTIIRGLTQSIDVGSGVTRTYQAIRGVTQALTVDNAVSRIYNGVRSLTQDITTSSAVTRLRSIIRGVDQGILVGVNPVTVSSITTIYGVLDAGTLASVITRDGVTYNVSEIAGAPGFRVQFESVIPDSSDNITFSMYAWYEGNPAHQIDLGVWNYSSSQWDNYTWMIPEGAALAWHNRTVTGKNHVSGQTVLFRLEHILPGNPIHDLFIDYVQVSPYVEFKVNRRYHGVRAITQGITVASDLVRVLTAGITNYIRGLSQSITASSAVSRMGIFMRGLSQNVDITTFLNYPGGVLIVPRGFLQILPIVGLIFVVLVFVLRKR